MRITDAKGVCPSNYKSSQLILNKYRVIDVIIMASGIIWGLIWFVLLMFVFVFNIYAIVFFSVIIPLIIIGMVQPMQTYHNNLEYIILCARYHLKDKDFTNLVQHRTAVLKKEKIKKRGRRKSTCSKK